MSITRAIIGTVVAGVSVVAAASPALATHDHVRHVGNGECVILAGGGGESSVELPASVADPGTYPEGRRHPLHVLVHKGEPGEQNLIEVLGQDTCTSYLNE